MVNSLFVINILPHFVICFLAFLLERTLEYLLKKDKFDLSPEEIRTAVNSMKFAQVEINKEIFLIKTKLENDAKNILKVLKISPPKNVTPINDLKI